MALVLSGLAFARGEMRQHREKQRRLATGPSEDLREAVADIRTLFENVIGSSGKTDEFFSDEENRQTFQRVVDLTGRVEDPNLRSSLERISSAWRDVSALAPPQRVRMYSAGQTNPTYVQEDIEDRAKHQRQVEEAEHGKDASESALLRLNKLDR